MGCVKVVVTIEAELYALLNKVARLNGHTINEAVLMGLTKLLKYYVASKRRKRST